MHFNHLKKLENFCDGSWRLLRQGHGVINLLCACDGKVSSGSTEVSVWCHRSSCPFLPGAYCSLLRSSQSFSIVMSFTRVLYYGELNFREKRGFLNFKSVSLRKKWKWLRTYTQALLSRESCPWMDSSMFVSETLHLFWASACCFDWIITWLNFEQILDVRCASLKTYIE